jgi:hypothetical protein
MKYLQNIKNINFEIHSYIGVSKRKEVTEIYPLSEINIKMFLHRNIRSGNYTYASLHFKGVSIRLMNYLEYDYYLDMLIKLIKNN